MQINDNKPLLFVSLTNNAGGAEQLMLMLAKTTNSELIFLKRNNKTGLDLEELEARFISEQSLVSGFLLLVPALWKYRQSHIIISSHAYLNAYLGILKRIKIVRTKVVVRESTSIFERFTGFKKLTYKYLYRLGYPCINLIICQTEVMRKQLLVNNKFIPPAKAIVISNPIDLVSVVNKSGYPFLLNNSDEYICAAGRLITIKGFDVLIKAFNKIAITHRNLKLMILGDGPEHGTLLSLIQSLNLTDRVILKGHQVNPFPYFKKARLCVVSSLKEGFPNVLLQMIALNTNVVTTLCAGGIEDIPVVTKVKPNDVNDLARGLTEALMMSNSTRRDELDEYLKRSSPSGFASTLIEHLNESK